MSYVDLSSSGYMEAKGGMEQHPGQISEIVEEILRILPLCYKLIVTLQNLSIFCPCATLTNLTPVTFFNAQATVYHSQLLALSFCKQIRKRDLSTYIVQEAENLAVI